MPSKVHELKLWEEYFDAVTDHSKKFEVRIADRDFEDNDYLLLREWDVEIGFHTGRAALCRVTYVLTADKAKDLGLDMTGLVVLSIEYMEMADPDYSEEYLAKQPVSAETDKGEGQ